MPLDQLFFLRGTVKWLETGLNRQVPAPGTLRTCWQARAVAFSGDFPPTAMWLHFAVVNVGESVDSTQWG